VPADYVTVYRGLTRLPSTEDYDSPDESVRGAARVLCEQYARRAREARRIAPAAFAARARELIAEYRRGRTMAEGKHRRWRVLNVLSLDSLLRLKRAECQRLADAATVTHLQTDAERVDPPPLDSADLAPVLRTGPPSSLGVRPRMAAPKAQRRYLPPISEKREEASHAA
jgi:hypothetical protein